MASDRSCIRSCLLLPWGLLGSECLLTSVVGEKGGCRYLRLVETADTAFADHARPRPVLASNTPIELATFEQHAATQEGRQLLR